MVDLYLKVQAIFRRLALYSPPVWLVDSKDDRFVHRLDLDDCSRTVSLGTLNL